MSADFIGLINVCRIILRFRTIALEASVSPSKVLHAALKNKIRLQNEIKRIITQFTFAQVQSLSCLGCSYLWSLGALYCMDTRLPSNDSQP